MFAKSILLAILGASMANAHMLMTSPVPYGKDSLNNSPLAADGSDFPCKQRSGVYDVTSENVMVIGESQPLTFEGSATHGGGSCQISLTTDLKPTKDTSWMVIKSFEGGCPANVDGNLSGGASMVDPYSFNFTIPSGIDAGKYTLAWTWFNRIGNREMYMNCAPVTVKTSSSKRSETVETKEVANVEKRSSSFPPMFVANVNGCTTSEGVDIRFPQPGNDVQYLGEAANLAKEGSAACTGTATFAAAGESTTGTSSGSGSSGSGSGSSSGSSSGSETSSAASAATSSSAPEPVSSSAPEPVSSSAPATQPAPEPVSTSSAANPASSSASSSSAGTLTGSCSPEGEWNCIAGSSFQRCANGVWTVSQQMASGTECTAGKSANMAIKASMRARAVSELRFRKRSVDSHHA